MMNFIPHKEIIEEIVEVEPEIFEPMKDIFTNIINEYIYSPFNIYTIEYHKKELKDHCDITST